VRRGADPPPHFGDRMRAVRPPLRPPPARLASAPTRPRPPRASDDGPDLVPLGDGLAADDGAPFGPLALLLVGFDAREAATVRTMMDGMDASMVAVVRATQGMLSEPLAAALGDGAPPDPSPPLDPATSPVPRAIIVSGMYAGELEDTMAGYGDAGLPPPLWCAALPANWGDRPLGQLVLDIAGDAAAMAGRGGGAGGRGV